MQAKNAVAALAALAQEARLNTFRLLVQAGPEGMAASRIAESLLLAPSTLSFHLKELVNAGMIEARQDGRYIIYSANFKSMNNLVTFLTENCCGGKTCK